MGKSHEACLSACLLFEFQKINNSGGVGNYFRFNRYCSGKRFLVKDKSCKKKRLYAGYSFTPGFMIVFATHVSLLGREYKTATSGPVVRSPFFFFSVHIRDQTLFHYLKTYTCWSLHNPSVIVNLSDPLWQLPTVWRKKKKNCNKWCDYTPARTYSYHTPG